MKAGNELTHFAGWDGAKDPHDVNILDRRGQVVAPFRFAHSGPGWQQWREKIQAYPALGVAIETSQRAAVEPLLVSGVRVYPVHPKVAKEYRKRQAPSGTKTDALDAWALTDALRMDGAHGRALSPQDGIVEELRRLCRDEEDLRLLRSVRVMADEPNLLDTYDGARTTILSATTGTHKDRSERWVDSGFGCSPVSRIQQRLGGFYRTHF